MKETLSPRIGIDLGGTKIEAIIMQTDGEISHRLRCDTPQQDYEGTVEAVVYLSQQICDLSGISQLTPIGIGTPGAISLKSGLMMNCNSTCLNGQPLPNDLAMSSGRQIRIANDADCFALSEASDGAAASSDWMMGLILGTGVGGGIVVKQRLTGGINAIRGEWGHNSLAIQTLQIPLPKALKNADHPCFCGRHDCIETWISGPAFERHYELMSGAQLSATEIMTEVRAGNPVANELFDCHVHITALAISSLINSIDPDTIVLGGGLSNIHELYEKLPAVLPAYVFSDVLNTQIIQAKHGDSGGVRGGCMALATRRSRYDIKERLMTPTSWQNIAFNPATESQNQIHSDEMAKAYGFRGGLVPGVVISSYLMEPAVIAWGEDWLKFGQADIKIVSPLYDGLRFEVKVTPETTESYQAELIDEEGKLCATGRLGLNQNAPAPRYQGHERLSDHLLVPAAIPDNMHRLREAGMKSLAIRWDESHKMAFYLRDESAMAPIHQPSHQGFAHGGFLLGITNWVLAGNATMNPWVHLQTSSQYFQSVPYGTDMIAECEITDLFTRRGHEFVDVEVSLFTEPQHEPVMSATLRAIYQMRPASS